MQNKLVCHVCSKKLGITWELSLYDWSQPSNQALLVFLVSPLLSKGLGQDLMNAHHSSLLSILPLGSTLFMMIKNQIVYSFTNMHTLEPSTILYVFTGHAIWITLTTVKNVFGVIFSQSLIFGSLIQLHFCLDNPITYEQH